MSDLSSAITREAEQIVHRELDRLGARLRSDAQRFERMKHAKDSPALVEFLDCEAEAYARAADLVLRIRAMLLKQSDAPLPVPPPVAPSPTTTPTP